MSFFVDTCPPQSVLLEDVSGYSIGPYFVNVVLNNIVPGLDDKGKILILESELRASGLNWTDVLYSRNKDQDYLCAVRSVYRDLSDLDITRDKAYLEKLLKDVENYAADDPKTIVIVNLSPLLLNYSLAKISRLLVAVTNTFNVRLSIFQIHSDCHPKAVREGLQRLVDATFTASRPNFDGRNGAKVLLKTFKTKGRNSLISKYYHVDCNFKFLQVTSDLFLDKVTDADVDLEAKVDSKGLESTFNLNLSLAEKEARNKVQMPFWRPEQLKGQPRGQVYYVADQGDDCDEEDPDDELNI